MHESVLNENQPNPTSRRNQVLRSYCATKGWTIVAEFIDVGKRNWKHPQLQALLADACKGAFERIVIQDFTHLSHSLSDALNVSDDLRRRGIAISTCTGDWDPTAPIIRLISAIYVAGNMRF